MSGVPSSWEDEGSGGRSGPADTDDDREVPRRGPQPERVRPRRDLALVGDPALDHVVDQPALRLLVKTAGSGRYRFVDWPAEKKAIDIGSFYADSSLFKSRTGWMPQVSLAEGLGRTFDYYRPRMAHYV